MNVLSLFDGISCAYEALNRSQIKINSYYASEIDKHAIIVSRANHPDIIQLGDVQEIKGNMLPKIDLLIGGSPCQDLSIAKKDRKGLEGNRSGLFWEYVRLLTETKPTYFILENVASMPKKDKDIITEAIGVEPVLFNASLVSAQCRKRLFWTNIKFELPEDKQDFDFATQGSNWWNVCWEMDQWLRGQTKHAPDDMSDDTYKALEECREKLREIISENNLYLDQ